MRIQGVEKMANIRYFPETPGDNGFVPTVFPFLLS
jgi:hypothetical protein